MIIDQSFVNTRALVNLRANISRINHSSILKVVVLEYWPAILEYTTLTLEMLTNFVWFSYVTTGYIPSDHNSIWHSCNPHPVLILLAPTHYQKSVIIIYLIIYSFLHLYVIFINESLVVLCDTDILFNPLVYCYEHDLCLLTVPIHFYCNYE